jgi:hypothetical protein
MTTRGRYSPPETDPNAVLLDQTTEQEIINGVPTLEADRTIDNPNHLVDALYVDNAVTSLGQRFYMLDTDSGVAEPTEAENYYLTQITPSEEAETSVTEVDPADNAYIAGWISPAGGAPTKLITGLYDWDIFALKSGGNKVYRLYWTLVERKSDNSEVVIGTSAESNILTTLKTRQRIPLTLSNDYIPDDDSRIVGKIYASYVSGASATNITLYSEGTSDSHWEIPTSKEILDTYYQPLNWGNIITTNETYQGELMNVTVDTNSIGFGALLAQADDFHFDEADANSVDTMRMCVMAVETGTGSKKVLLRGQICDTSWNWVSGAIYASETSGGLTQDPDTAICTEDAVVAVMGWALSADTIYFSPYDSWATRYECDATTTTEEVTTTAP